MSESQVTCVVRQFGYNPTHVATVPRGTLATLTVFGKDYVGIPHRIVARCGSVLRTSESRPAIVMAAGTGVSCALCRTATGITVQAEDVRVGEADGQ